METSGPQADQRAAAADSSSEVELRTRVRQPAAVAELGQLALSNAELAEVMDKAVRLLTQTLEVEFAQVFELLPDGKALLLKAGAGWPEELVGQATVDTGLKSPAGYALFSNAPVIIEDLRTESRFQEPPLFRDQGVVSGVSIIIDGGGTPYGVLGAHTIRRRAFTQEDIHFVQAMANVLASSIHRRLTERRLTVQADVSQVLARATSLEAASPELLERIGVSFGWELGFLWKVDADAQTLQFTGGWRPPTVQTGPFIASSEESRFGRGKGLPGRVWETATPAAILDISKDGNFPRRSAALQAGLQGAVAFPLLDQAEVLGVIEFFSKNIRQPEADMLRTMATLGNQIGQFIRREGAEQNLARYKEIFTHSNDGIAVIDLHGRYLEQNGSHEELFGYSLEEIQGLTPAVHMGEETFRRVAEELLHTGRFRGEVTSRTKRGEQLDIELSAFTLRDAAGQPVCYIGIKRDITERKKRMEELSQSESRYRRLVELAPLAIAVHQDQRLVYANPAAAQLVGAASPEEIIGRPVMDFVHPDYREPLLMRTREARAEGKATEPQEEKLLRVDGEVLDVEMVSMPFTFGGRMATQVLVRDVTERKRAEEALLRSEAMKSAILESALDAVVTMDHHGVVLDFNPSAERIFGYSALEALGQPMSELIVPPSLRGRHRAGLARYLATGEAKVLGKRIEITGMRKDGSEFPVELGITRIGLEGPPIFTAYISDITERKRAEEALREVDRRKDEFLAMLSHELRNPLAPISNALQLLHVDEDDPTQQEVLDVLDRQVHTLARLVDDLLDVSRVTTGRIQLQQVDLDLNDLVQGIGVSFRSLMSERQHQFSVSLSGKPLWVHADGTRLEQVVVNLLSNAAKYTPEGGQVWLTTEKDGDQAVIRVKDNGMGMEGPLLPTVFELFTQGKRSLDRREGGLGLGLSLVKSLVNMHGGTVTAASDGPGKGSEFIVRLPLRPLPAEPVRSHPPVPVKERPATELRVLVVDDNRDAADIMARLLRRKGYAVETAYDGPAAVQTALNSSPDIVLLDIGLPGLDGYEVAQRIRQEEVLRGIVLVAMTGYGQAEDMRRSKEVGFDHHLLKPADLATLQNILESAKDTRVP